MWSIQLSVYYLLLVKMDKSFWHSPLLTPRPIKVWFSRDTARFIKPYRDPVDKSTLDLGKVLLNGRYIELDLLKSNIFLFMSKHFGFCPELYVYCIYLFHGFRDGQKVKNRIERKKNKDSSKPGLNVNSVNPPSILFHRATG